MDRLSKPARLTGDGFCKSPDFAKNKLREVTIKLGRVTFFWRTEPFYPNPTNCLAALLRVLRARGAFACGRELSPHDRCRPAEIGDAPAFIASFSYSPAAAIRAES
jgi:hypothetical protein